MINPALAPITKLRATERAFADRESRVTEKTHEILSSPDQLGSLIQDNCLNPALTHQLSALCRAEIEMQANYRPNGELNDPGKNPFDSDVNYHALRLCKVLKNLARQEADAAIPEVDAQAISDAEATS
jgi:hypothetical protein